jgi:hypothetical protein
MRLFDRFCHHSKTPAKTPGIRLNTPALSCHIVSPRRDAPFSPNEIVKPALLKTVAAREYGLGNEAIVDHSDRVPHKHEL